MKINKISFLGILGVIFFVSTTFIAGLQFPNYSHTSQFISESYAIGTPYGLYLRLFGFIPSGIFLTLFSFSAANHFPENRLTKIGFLGIGVFYGMATIIASIFPCDQGCNKEFIDPSISQIIHNLAGGLTYLIVPVCVLLIGIAAVKWQHAKQIMQSGIALGLISMIFVSLLTSNPQSQYLGLIQRIIEGSILSFILVCSVYLQKRTISSAVSVEGHGN